MGAFESALLYAPNWLHLFLPLAAAVNAVIILHVFLAGFFTFLWARRRGASLTGSALSGVIFMFSGPFFLRIYAGHVPPLCVMAWTPALFCAIDGWSETGAVRWLLAGMAAVCLQVLAGNPQYAYYTALFAGLLALGSERRLKAAGGVAAMYGGGAALSAVQILTGLEAASESVRAGGIPYDFAATFSLPLENIPTLFAPRMLGGLSGFPYFGQWYYWEGVVFVGAAALILAVAGAKRRGLAVLALLSLTLALGANTPLFGLLYRFLPGYSLFRGTAKLGFLTALFLAMLAAEGFDRLREEKPKLKTAALAAAAGLLAALAGLVLARGGAARLLGFIGAAKSLHLPGAFYLDGAFARGAAVQVGTHLALSGAVFAVVAILAWLMTRSRRFVYGLAALVIVESVVFAGGNLAAMRLELSYPAAWKEALDARGDSRVLHDPFRFPNAAMKLGADDVWGYGSFVLRRYAQFMAYGQGADPRFATQYLAFKNYPKALSLLRCRYAFLSDAKQTILSLPSPLSRVELVDGWRVEKDRDGMLKSLFDPRFDPRKTVLLEREPSPAPVRGAGAPGTAEVLAATTDSLEIKADLSRASILLITDPYSRGWRALALEPSPQTRYEVLPADFVVRAVPLTAGAHHLRVEYAPMGFRVGRWISLAAFLLFLIACRLSLARRIW